MKWVLGQNAFARPCVQTVALSLTDSGNRLVLKSDKTQAALVPSKSMYKVNLYIFNYKKKNKSILILICAVIYLYFIWGFFIGNILPPESPHLLPPPPKEWDTPYKDTVDTGLVVLKTDCARYKPSVPLSIPTIYKTVHVINPVFRSRSLQHTTSHYRNKCKQRSTKKCKQWYA